MREWLAKLALSAVSLVCVALVFELALRTVVRQGGPPLVYLPDARLGHILKPNLDFDHLWDARESRGRIRTNSLGLRDDEIPLPKPVGEYRILMIGDSYTFGYGVDQDETVSALLEEGLAARASASEGALRVINAGVTAYGTGNEVVQFETLGRELQADLVVLNMFLGNDVQENLCIKLLSQEPRPHPPCFALENGTLRERDVGTEDAEGGSAPAASLARRVVDAVRGSALVSYASQQARRVLTSNAWVARLLQAVGVEVHPGYLPHVVTGWYTPEYAVPGWELTRALILRLRDDVVATGARFAIVVIPSRIQVLPGLRELGRVMYADDPDVARFLEDPGAPQRRLADFAAAEGIPLLDLRPVLAGHERVEDLYFPVIAHWNAEGHRVATREIEAFLEREGLAGPAPAAAPGASSQPSSAIDAASASPESS